MKKLTLSIVLVLFSSISAISQQLIEAELLHTWSTTQLTLQGVFGAQNGATMYKLIYQTPGADGEPTIASGALFIPDLEECSLPIAVYNHGTVFEKEDVPSRNNGEALIGKFMAGFGFVSVLPDYLGLGDSPGLHPYVHADSEARATIDMIRAVKEFCAETGIALNDELFITGYSQGGHAAMATVYEMETNLSDEFTVTASAPASGPYDISGSQAGPVSSDEPYASPEYLPYVIFSYQMMYGNIYDTPSDFLVSPYDTLLPPLFDGEHTGGQIAAMMPDVPAEIIQPDELAEFVSNPEHPMRLALAENDRYDWAPQSPMRLYYCTADEQVFPSNSIVTHATMLSNGATDVTLMDMGELSHGGCAMPSLVDVLFWFIELKTPCAGVNVEEHTVQAFEVAPNPATTQVKLRFEENLSGNIRVHDITGKTVFTQPFNGSSAVLSTDHLSRGLYFISIDEIPGKVERIILR